MGVEKEENRAEMLSSPTPPGIKRTVRVLDEQTHPLAEESVVSSEALQGDARQHLAGCRYISLLRHSNS